VFTFRVLGPLSVTAGDTEVELTSVRQRRLLAALLLRAGRPVTMSTLIDAVWDERPPRSAVNSAQSYVSRLRASLAADLLAWTGSGYVLRTAPEAVDAQRFESLIQRARSVGHPRESIDPLDRALALWQGTAYPDLAHHEPAAAEAARLTELQLTARELRADALLELGRLDEAVAALRALTVGHPLRERPWRALMLALHRAGRQAEALAAFRRYDEVLAAQGLEPAESVKELRTAILVTPEVVRHPAPHVADVLPRESRGWPAPAQLPAPPAAFTGRGAYLDRLDALLTADAAAQPRALVISTVAGAAGIGKTALAVQWAHRVRGRFGDGQLFADLRGYAAGPPVRPIDALAGFLSALGVPAEQVPTRLDQAAALFRTLTTGRRLLVVLDNARGVEQVRPLLPGDPGSLVLITSRVRLAGLVARDGAQPVLLGALDADEAHELLARLLGPERVAAEPAATGQLVRECASLPLALRIAAATLAWRPGQGIGDYVERLRHNRLGVLAIDGDPDSTVRDAFALSYAALPPAARRQFRLLSLVPGPDLDPAAAAAVADLPAAVAADLLDRLAGAHLLDQPAPGRYALHDLLRAFAAERTREEDASVDRDAATSRLYAWYLSMVDAAADLLYPHMLRLPRPPMDERPARFAGHADALAWLDAERRNLVAAVRAAVEHGPRRAGCLLADVLRGYFHLRRYAADWLAVADAALAAAEADRDPRAEAAARHSLGTAYRCLGDLDGAQRQYVRVLRLARRCGWRESEATTLGNLGLISQGRGRLKAAARQLTAALAVDRRIGRGAGVANNVGLLAAVYHDMGRLAEAAAHFAEAVELNRLTGAQHGQALALTGLGDVCRELGRLDVAADHLDRALRHYARVGDRDGAAIVHHRLAAVNCDLGRTTEAREHALTSLSLARETGDPRTEAAALTALATVYGRIGDHREALFHHRRAYDLTHEATSPRTQIEALVGLAEAALGLGRLADARHHAGLALHLAARGGYRVPEGDARTTLARIALADDDAAGAVEEAGLAAATHEQTGRRLGLTRTLEILAQARRPRATTPGRRCG
jgi:DNA-binding SARP family transcriptional activator